MNQVISVDLYGASLADVEGRQYASLFVGQAVIDEKEESAKGIIVMKLPCDPEVYNQLRIARYPAQVELHIRLKKAAGGRMGQHAVKVEPKNSHSTGVGHSPVSGSDKKVS